MTVDRKRYVKAAAYAIASRRAALDRTQGQIAGVAGLSQSALSRFENGQSLPDLHEAHMLAEALGWTPEELTRAIGTMNSLLATRSR